MSRRELHTLTIESREAPSWAKSPWGSRLELGEWTFSIACPGCKGWIECSEAHDGHDPDEPDSPAYDREDDVEIHGVSHDWRHGHGWTVPYPGCVVAGNEAVRDYAHDILVTYGPGSYLVDDDWSDDELTLTAVSMADDSQLPEPGWAERTAPYDGDREAHHAH